MKVEDILRTKGARVVTVGADERIADAAKLLMRERIGAIVVCDPQQRPRAVLSERDIVHGLSTHGAEVLHMPIDALMHVDVVTCSLQDSLLKVMAMMTDRRVRHLPVTDKDGRLCGIVSVGDAVKGRMEEIEAEASALRDYIATA